MQNLPARSVILCVLLVLFTLGPMATQLRTQHPWNCFQLTLDESYYVQAFVNWSKGLGYLAHEHSKPFDPGISSGITMAWGTSLIRRLTHFDWPQAGRLWVYLNYHLVLVLLARVAWIRTRSWNGIWVALAFMGLYMTQVPAGGYLIYGILGEVPAGLIAVCAMLCIGRFRFLAGVLGVAAFVAKPTYGMILPAISIASFWLHGRRGLRTAFATAAASLAWIVWVSGQRGETIAEYLGVFRYTAGAISLQNQSARFFDYYHEAPWFIAAFGVGYGLLLLRGLGHRRGHTPNGFEKDPLRAEEVAAWTAAVIAAIWFLIQQRRPLDKHWFAMTYPAAFFLCIRLSIWFTPWLDRKVAQEVLKPVLITIAAAWLINIPSLQRRYFEMGPERGCPVKEQRAVDRFLVEIGKTEKLSKENLIGIVSIPSIWFVYELGINPKYYIELSDAPRPLPKWVVGETSKLTPTPQECTVAWDGAVFSALRCGS